MADEKISDLTASTTPVDTDLFEMETAGGLSRKMTRAYMHTALFSDSEGDPAQIGSAADGTSVYGARRDHVHAIAAASTTVVGAVELAIDTEVTTGTDATRAVTPDGLAGSTIFGVKAFAIEVFAAGTALTTGDGKKYIPIPAALNGMNLIAAHVTLYAKSTSGTPTVQIARGRRPDATTAHSFVDMFSTLITVDANEFDSRTAATAPVINTSNDDLATADLLRVDVDVAGTAATGMWITFEAQLP